MGAALFQIARNLELKGFPHVLREYADYDGLGLAQLVRSAK